MHRFKKMGKGSGKSELLPMVTVHGVLVKGEVGKKARARL